MTKKPVLVMVKGLPASGKTTYARTLVDKGYVRVNKDDLRAMMHNSKWSKGNEKQVLYARDTAVRNALFNGQNVIVDDTNFAPGHEATLRQIAQDTESNFEAVVIDTPLEECIKRNENRANKVPVSVIVTMHSRYIAAPNTPEKPEYEDDLEECIIVDVDGTLAHIATGPDGTVRSVYDATRAGEDSVDDAVSSVVAMAYSHGYKVIILTGRGLYEGHLEATKAWLDSNGINYDEIYSRKVGDDRKDTEVKSDLYTEHIKGKYNVKFVFDDRPSVCRMWRSKGLPTFQVGDVHNEF